MQSKKRYTTALNVFFIIQAVRASLHIILFLTSKERWVIEKDMDRWLKILCYEEQLRYSPWKRCAWLIWRYPEFRSVFYYRVECELSLPRKILIEIAKWWFTPMANLYIYTPVIGAGLFIEHGFSTVISAHQIGENCWINQQVTIGYTNATDRPILGNNVTVTAGAIILGDVHIGNNTIIGANSVVVKNVPDNCTVVGVPAYVIRRNGEKVNEPL